MSELHCDTVFVALTRPQMLGGVTYSFVVLNGLLGVEMFLIFKSFKILIAAGIIHIFGAIVCAREPRFFDLWIARMRHCPRIKNYRYWQCNSYRP